MSTGQAAASTAQAKINLHKLYLIYLPNVWSGQYSTGNITTCRYGGSSSASNIDSAKIFSSQRKALNFLGKALNTKGGHYYIDAQILEFSGAFTKKENIEDILLNDKNGNVYGYYERREVGVLKNAIRTSSDTSARMIELKKLVP